MEAIWKDIYGYEGYYQISNYGRVKSLSRIINTCHKSKRTTNEKILKHSFNRRYPFVGLNRYGISKNKSIHRLIAVAFIPNPENKPCINHKDGNPSNKDIINLEWVTHSENDIHAVKIGLRKYIKGKDNHTSKPVIQLTLDNEFIEYHDSIKIASIKTGIIASNIGRACSNKRETAGGYKWEYAKAH